LLVFKGITDQFIEPTGLSTFNLPADAFAHSNADATLSLAAKLTNGDPLPGWVQFNAQAGTFQVTPPPGFSGELEISVSARDDQGREATATFKFNVGQGSPAPAGSDGQAAPQGAPGQPGAQPAVGPQGRSSFTDQLRLAKRGGGMLDLLRAQSDRMDLGRPYAGVPAERTAGSGGLLERLMASRAVQERLAQRVSDLEIRRGDTAGAFTGQILVDGRAERAASGGQALDAAGTRPSSAAAGIGSSARAG
jgi:hypothetical protein